MINTKDGVGIEFTRQNKKCITIPRIGIKLKVAGSVNTYGTIVIFSEHFYGYLDVLPCQCKEIESGKTFSSYNQPQSSRGKNINVTHRSQITTYKHNHLDKKVVDIRKGDETMRFPTVQECISHIESTFTSLFGLGWELVGSNYEPWAEYKNEIIEVYSKSI